tara:strand:- start:2065 stop:2385 length:321 start_codon:yes stop_codon:yes gene_type:complete
LLGSETLLLQGLKHLGHLISLELDHSIFEAAAAADSPLELFEQSLGIVIGQFKASDLRNGLSLLASPGALHPNPLLCPRCLWHLRLSASQGRWITAELAPTPLAHG